MKGYLGIIQIVMPPNCLEKAFYSLREAGKQGVESVALFIGRIDGNDFFIEETIIPKHTSYRLEDGLFYAIDSDELYRLNVMLHERSLKLIAQIHSHPREAYHSEADDQYAIATKVGSISIVVPDFAFGPISLDNCAVYRLSVDNKWLKLSHYELHKLIVVE